MWVYRLILCVVVVIFLEEEKVLLQQEDLTLLCASNLLTKEVFGQIFGCSIPPSQEISKQKTKHKVDTNSSVNQWKCGT